MTAADRLTNTVHDEEHLPALATQRRGGTPVDVSFTPNAAVDDVAKMAVKVQRLGITAVPHIVARRKASLRYGEAGRSFREHTRSDRVCYALRNRRIAQRFDEEFGSTRQPCSHIERPHLFTLFTLGPGVK